jgi:hypothetical protein
MKVDVKNTTLVQTDGVAESPLDAILEQLPTGDDRGAQGLCLLGEVVDARHPTLTGRVLVRWAAPAGERERWLPTLQGLPVRVADRVLLVQPINGSECIVVGVVDGFAKRPEPARATAASIELQRDEAVRVTGIDGQELIEIHQSENGPVVRLLQDDVNLQLSGKLRIRAKGLELAAEQGPVKISATDDVVIKGEVIHLN